MELVVEAAAVNPIERWNRSAAAARKGAERVKTGWPDGFFLTVDRIAWARARGIVGDVSRVWKRFGNYSRARGLLFADWDVAWQAWVSGEVATVGRGAESMFAPFGTMQIERGAVAPAASAGPPKRRQVRKSRAKKPLLL